MPCFLKFGCTAILVIWDSSSTIHVPINPTILLSIFATRYLAIGLVNSSI